jgi:phosphoglycolate phosphatase-like HAD superfamily hydrolase
MLLLFDIDGTLVSGAADAHSAALYAALEEVHGLTIDRDLPVGLEPAGRTDGEIARLILLANYVPAKQIDARSADVRIACCEAYARLCPDDLSHTVLPGVPELLRSLAARDDVRLALLTGNYEPVARLKLRRAGIGRFFATGQGAFGSDSEDRTDLPAIARRRAALNGVAYPRERTIVIGDTPRDIACARADGVRCIAVASGHYTSAKLRDAAADVVGEDARELEVLLESVPLLRRVHAPPATARGPE